MGQFSGTNSDGAFLTPAERGRLAGRMLRNHREDGHELVTCLALEDFFKWYRTVREAAAQPLPQVLKTRPHCKWPILERQYADST